MQPRPDLAGRLRAFAEPARDVQLPSHDLVHQHFNLTNVLVNDDVVCGVVDWDDAGRGCRALDVTTLLSEWHRLGIGGSDVPVGGGERLLVASSTSRLSEACPRW